MPVGLADYCIDVLDDDIILRLADLNSVKYGNPDGSLSKSWT